MTQAALDFTAKEILGARRLIFDGSDYKPELDHARLTGQLLAIFELMRPGRWLTLREISEFTGAPESSASAQLRNMKKSRFGGHTVEKRRRGDKSRGLWEYKLIVRGK